MLAFARMGILGAALFAGSSQAKETAVEPVLPNWLAGGWVAEEAGGKWVEEWWTSARAGIMLGAGRSGKGPALEWWEQTRIESLDGKLRFCAMPKGQAGACFGAIRATPTEIVFENPGHDFPTRVAYRKDGDQLQAEISGPDGANPQRWRFRRAN